MLKNYIARLFRTTITSRLGDGERQGDEETVWGDGETRRLGARETGRLGDRLCKPHIPMDI